MTESQLDVYDLNNTMKQLNLKDSYRTLNSEINIFFKWAGKFTHTDHIQGHKTNLKRYKIETLQGMFSDKLNQKSIKER